MISVLKYRLGSLLGLVMLFMLLQSSVSAADKDFPDQPNPPVLVNDFAHVLSPGQVSQLEEKLEDYARTTSTQISVVTIKNIGDYDVEEYTVKLFNKWGVGQKDKNNGVMILAAIDNHKVNISTGGGVQGDLTDAMCGRIIRNEIVPAFKQNNYFEGFMHASDAIIAATKGEYKADDKTAGDKIPGWAILLLVAGIYFVIWLLSKLRGGGGGTYMSGRGFGGYGGGWFMGGGGFGGRGGGGFGGGGFGGFGGGGSDGGGASGSW